MKQTEKEKEKELIEVLRSYRNSYPNGHPKLLEYAMQLFDELSDPFKENQQ